MEVEKELKLFEELLAASEMHAAEALNKIAEATQSSSNIENATSRQTVLNMGIRAYYKVLYKHSLQDNHFENIIDEIATIKHAGAFEMLHAILLSERGKHIETNLVKEICLKTLAANAKNSSLLIMKNLNILLRKDSSLEVDMPLAQVYLFLQSTEIGMREEVLLFFNHCCRPLEGAQKYFQFIVEHYPWTNRNKYYMLSSILNKHDFERLRSATKHDPQDFFAGLRLSLSYKHLLPASQYLVKALSKQDSLYLLELSAVVLAEGSLEEVANFSAHWFSRISQKESLFHLVYKRLENQNIFSELSTPAGYRFIHLFVLNSRYIIDMSKLTFFGVSTELITNCFDYKNEAQILIYKFIAENMSFFALEDCLEFFESFIRRHRYVENAQMRNTILGKIPMIINYISKVFFKVQKHTRYSATTLETSVGIFFTQLHEIILDDIGSKIYQPKIFALKLLDILLKSLYQENLEKNAKNCNVRQNEKLGALLVSQGVFDASQMTKQLVAALNDPQCYDDALDLCVELIQRLGNVEYQGVFDSCQKCCQSVDIDECALSPYYAQVALKVQAQEANCDLYTFALEKLQNALVHFQKDPLATCKRENHIFGYLETINAVLQGSSKEFVVGLNFAEMLDVLEKIESIVLEFLNSSSGLCEEQVFAASFQDMDENLEILVEKSEFEDSNHEQCRKFLLMSFWITLKACCDASTTLGYYLASTYHTSESDGNCIKNLRRCLNLHVAVLIRCRHKGAIEAAGLSIGKLTKNLTSKTNAFTVETNELLWECLSVLFENKNNVSATRRGAGYSIMLLHVIKNDSQCGSPLLKRAMERIFEILQCKVPTTTTTTSQKSNCDRIEALTLHYLCVLVKDADIKNTTFSYYNDIMLAAIAKIDDPEWTVCNAALQLFGAVVPKVIGQRQATEFVEPLDWEPTQVTYAEIIHHMPKIIEKILSYCKEQSNKCTSTRSIILFLGFLSKIEYLPQDTQQNEEALRSLNELMWSFLQHRCEKIRKLAATCFVRCQDFRCQLPHALLYISDLLFEVRNENFFEGLVFVLCEGVAKMKNEALHTIPANELNHFYQTLRESIARNAKFEYKFKSYTQVKLLHLFEISGLLDNSSLIREFVDKVNLNAEENKYSIGHEEWCQSVEKLKKNGLLQINIDF